MRLRATQRLRTSNWEWMLAERGNVVHKALECFWNEVKTQSVLKTMPEDEREEVLSWAIDERIRRGGLRN